MCLCSIICSSSTIGIRYFFLYNSTKLSLGLFTFVNKTLLEIIHHQSFCDVLDIKKGAPPYILCWNVEQHNYSPLAKQGGYLDWMWSFPCTRVINIISIIHDGDMPFTLFMCWRGLCTSSFITLLLMVYPFLKTFCNLKQMQILASNSICLTKPNVAPNSITTGAAL